MQRAKTGGLALSYEAFPGVLTNSYLISMANLSHIPHLTARKAGKHLLVHTVVTTNKIRVLIGGGKHIM